MRIVIVGGGSAGWITALYARAFLPGAEITVVESSEIGILGAGEGVTPHFVSQFLDQVGIPVSDLIKHTGTTLKIGIKFTNWNGDGTSYFHPFEDTITPALDLQFLDLDQPGLGVADTHFSSMLAARGKVAARPKPPFDRQPGTNPILHFERFGTFAVHFDASRLAVFLKGVARTRGITLVEGKVSKVAQRPDGQIGALLLEDGRTLPTDFVFDCSGMHRLLIGKVFQSPWVDVQDVLPADRALPFFLPIDGPRPPYTEAIAMDSGWAWKIPVQDRYGCGYVFDSSFATEDEARAEVRTKFGDELELPRVIPFRAGYYEQIWVKNCVAIGLSSGFLEPLEATAIWALILTLREFLRGHMATPDEASREAFNAYHRKLNERIVAFLHLHYLSRRRDTPFWATFQDRTRRPPLVEEMLRPAGMRWHFENPDALLGHPAPFLAVSYAHIAAGLGLFDIDHLRQHVAFYGLHEGQAERTSRQRAHIEQLASQCVLHDDFLDYMKRG
jgi:tryptophan halogenase